jgi:hypothetical protein
MRTVWCGCISMAAMFLLAACEDDETGPQCGQRSRPFLLGESASPHLGDMTVFQRNPATSQYTPIEFSADMVSDDAGQPVQSVLLIDYGDDNAVSNGPYRSFVPGEPLDPACMLDGPRHVSIPWRPLAQEPIGCHTVTLMVTHQFELKNSAFYCPADPNDASTLTWFALVCGDASTTTLEECYAANPCPIAEPNNAVYCADT